VIGAEIMFCNITSKRTFQAELVEQHALLDAMLESTPDPVFILDSKLQLKRCNPTAEALFPDRKCGSGLPVLELFGENDLDTDKIEMLQSKFATEQLFDLELNFGERHFDMHAGPLRSQQKGWVCVLHDITARKRTEEELQYVAFHDVMTKLPNRAYFIEKLERIVKRAKQEPAYTFALLFIDLDRLKLVNDNHGHHAGDQLLTEFARRLEACIRPGDMVCRLGGDEFAIFLDNIQGRGTAEQVTQRIYESLQRPFNLNGGTPTQATASVGIAFSGDETMDLDALLRQADGAMYQVKEGGGDGFLVYGD
jgi:diguanylate cyclase (GGDEF)-like protein/PAS domain S-box-containing protein